jgi:hypothetical protein
MLLLVIIASMMTSKILDPQIVVELPAGNQTWLAGKSPNETQLSMGHE